MPDRRILGGQPAGRQAGRHHRVGRQRVVEPLRKLQPGLDPLNQLLTRYGVTLLDELSGQWRRRGSRGVGPRDADVAALRRPVVVDLANQQLRRAVRGDPPLEGAVGGDVEFAVVERRLADRHVVVGVLTAEHLEAQVGGGAALAGDDVLVAGLHPGAEVQRVGIVQTHLGERPGTRLHEGMVAVVVERQVGAAGDAAGQVLQALEQIGFGFDEGAAATRRSASAIASVSGWEYTPTKLERVLILSQQLSATLRSIFGTQRYIFDMPSARIRRAGRRRRPSAWSPFSTSSPATRTTGSDCPNWPAGSG